MEFNSGSLFRFNTEFPSILYVRIAITQLNLVEKKSIKVDHILCYFFYSTVTNAYVCSYYQFNGEFFLVA